MAGCAQLYSSSARLGTSAGHAVNAHRGSNILLKTVIFCQLGLMQISCTILKDKFSSKFFNTVRNSKKIKNPAAQNSEEFFSLSTGAAENFYFSCFASGISVFQFT
jgi:hypothetical protein